MSFSQNIPFQLKNLISLNDEGTVDRKLNVALTRAKEQLILIGNDSFLSQNLIYYKLIEFVKSRVGYVWNDIQDVLAGNVVYDELDSKDSSEEKVYLPDDEFIQVFNDKVISPLKNDSRTKDAVASTRKHYYEVLLGQSGDFIRNNVIEYGITQFDESNHLAPEFNPEDKVTLYCFYNMRKHYFLSYSIFKERGPLITTTLSASSGRITFFDFGCGSLTSGLAFNKLYREEVKNFNYVGIDASNAMLAKAREFGSSRLFKNVKEKLFINQIDEIPETLLNEWFTLPNTVILNFSYLFNSLTVESIIDVAQNVNQLILDYPLNRYLLIYQNSVYQNRSFEKFKQLLSTCSYYHDSGSIRVSYPNADAGFYDKSEFLTYELLSSEDVSESEDRNQ